MSDLKDFETLPTAVQMDGAFLIGLIGPEARTKLRAVPVKVDGWQTIVLCIEAKPPGEDRTCLHPVAVVPHRHMTITDLRQGAPQEPAIRRVPIRPTDRQLSRLMLEAQDDPNVFFREHLGD